jgi:hypothetical protein
MASFPVKTDPMSSLSGYFQMRQPRAADMQPSPPQSSGFSAPSATESAFHVLASNPPDTTKSATFSTPPMRLPEGGQTQAQTFGGPPTNSAIQGKASAPNIAPGYTGGHTPATRFSQGMSKGSTQPAYASAGDSVPKGGKGGTGFTSFNQYFGANAPAAEAMTPLTTAPTGWSSADAFNAMLSYPAEQRQAEQMRQQAEQRAAQNKAAFAQQQAAAQAQREARARSVAEQGRGPEAQQMRAEERPDTRKQQSERRGSRFDDYFVD